MGWVFRDAGLCLCKTSVCGIKRRTCPCTLQNCKALSCYCVCAARVCTKHCWDLSAQQVQSHKIVVSTQRNLLVFPNECCSFKRAGCIEIQQMERHDYPPPAPHACVCASAQGTKSGVRWEYEQFPVGGSGTKICFLIQSPLHCLRLLCPFMKQWTQNRMWRRTLAEGGGAGGLMSNSRSHKHTLQPLFYLWAPALK